MSQSQWKKDLADFADTVKRRQRAAFIGVTEGCFQSIVEGSALTGAPGQPVQTSRLKTSWGKEYPSEFVSEIVTSVEYALPIEEGVGRYGPMTLRSKVGGFHSVKLTLQNAGKIIRQVLKSIK